MYNYSVDETPNMNRAWKMCADTLRWLEFLSVYMCYIYHLFDTSFSLSRPLLCASFCLSVSSSKCRNVLMCNCLSIAYSSTCCLSSFASYFNWYYCFVRSSFHAYTNCFEHRAGGIECAEYCPTKTKTTTATTTTTSKKACIQKPSYTNKLATC